MVHGFVAEPRRCGVLPLEVTVCESLVGFTGRQYVASWSLPIEIGLTVATIGMIDG